MLENSDKSIHQQNCHMKKNVFLFHSSQSISFLVFILKSWEPQCSEVKTMLLHNFFIFGLTMCQCKISEYRSRKNPDKILLVFGQTPTKFYPTHLIDLMLEKVRYLGFLIFFSICHSH